MPCYEVRTVQVEFKARNREALQEALESNGIDHWWNTSWTKVYGKEWEIDLEKQTAQVTEGKEVYLNRVRRAYSETVIAEVARKKKWIVKKLAAGKMQLKRY